MTMIPMLNLKKQLASIEDEVMKSISEVLSSAQYVLGPRVRELEEKIASYVGTESAVSVASGTDALHLSVKSLGIGSGDEVITTPFTFFATVESIMYERARPVFVDIDPATFNIDVTRIEEKITPRTKAIIPVHMFGHPADMQAINAIADRHSLTVIEDCAQAIGATINGKKVGSFGDAGCFSFYPSKNLGACGDAGMITLSNDEIDADMRKFRNHGAGGTYIHLDVGFNSRLDEIQAAILLIKLRHLDEYNARRVNVAAMYNKLLAGVVECPTVRDGCYHVYHQYTIRHPERDRIREALQARDIGCNVYYPVPMHLQPALAEFGLREGHLPNAEKASREVLSLPICPELEPREVELIAETIKSAL